MYDVGFEVLLAVVMKSSIVWDMVDFQRTTRRYIPEDRTHKFGTLKWFVDAREG
jgi:hypothetical protein